jgi:hypothetical protein
MSTKDAFLKASYGFMLGMLLRANEDPGMTLQARVAIAKHFESIEDALVGHHIVPGGEYYDQKH